MNNCPILIRNSEEYLGKWKSLFNNSNPIYVEIGMGKGDFIIENARNNPNINYIGIEKFDSVIVRAVEKVPEDLPNLILVRMDALDIDKVFKKEIDRIYLNFSDPWPKNRHADRRLTSHIFLEKYDKIFKNKKEIIQKTDNRGLFEYSIVSLSTYGYTINDITFDLHNRDESIIMTEYEKKFVSKGNNIYYLIATKK
jgi:tRNA (guanine-N7-)-methyltransferase